MDYLIYSSHKASHCTDDQIDKILESCRRNNTNKNITGILVHTDKFFIQYLEGKMEEIMPLYEKIKDDDRHSNILLLNKGTIEKRHFPRWFMGCKDYDTKKLDIESSFTSSERIVIEGVLSGQKVESDRALDLLVKFYKLI